MFTSYFSRAAQELVVWSFAELRAGNRGKAIRLRRIADRIEARRREHGMYRRWGGGMVERPISEDWLRACAERHAAAR